MTRNLRWWKFNLFADTNSNLTLFLIMIYTVFCPKTQETEICSSQEEACDVCFDMHNETGNYVWVEDYLGHTVIEYGDIESVWSFLTFADSISNDHFQGTNAQGDSNNCCTTFSHSRRKVWGFL